jgi:hypothetical protein
MTAILSRNSATTERDNVLAYFACSDGTLMLAPDTRVSLQQCGLDPKRWRKCEAVGAKEMEQVSVILARQEFEKKRRMKVEKALRELEFLRQSRAGARLRASMNYSPNDVRANLLQERRWAAREDYYLNIIASEVDPSQAFDPTKRTTMLEVEMGPRSLSPLANVNQKPTGIVL